METEMEAGSEIDTSESEIETETESESESESEEQKEAMEAMKRRLELEAEMERKAEMETEDDIEFRLFLQRNNTMDLDLPEDSNGGNDATLEDQDEDQDQDQEKDDQGPQPRPHGMFHPKTLELLPTEPLEVKLWSFLKTFSTTAIDGLRLRVAKETEQNITKLVYMAIRNPADPTFSTSWMVVDPNDLYSMLVGPKATKVVFCNMWCEDDDMRNPSNFLFDFDINNLRHLTCYGCAVWDSKIVIAGGRIGEDASSVIIVYDTSTKLWVRSLPMAFCRGEKPTVVVADNKILIFGGDPQYPDRRPVTMSEFWGEAIDVTNLTDHTSEYVRHYYPLPVHSTDTFPKIISHAVHSKRDTILFWLDNPYVVLSFNYRQDLWEKYENPLSIDLFPQWNTTVAVFEDMLFWHHRGTIFAHDLLNHVTIPTYTLPRTGFSRLLFSDQVPPSFLVHIGKGKLCLFYQVEHRIRYFTFFIKPSQLTADRVIPSTILGRSAFLQTPLDSDIMHTLELSC